MTDCIDTEYVTRKLITKSFIEEIIYLPETDSTNQYAKKLKDKDNVLVITDFQKFGKGRRENTWISAKRENLTFTIIKKFPISNKDLQYINYFFTTHTAEFIQKYLLKYNISEKTFIKWPNDILTGNKKICGILIEHNFSTHTFYIGIGINLNQITFPRFKNLQASSLKNITGNKINRNDFLTRLILYFSKNLNLLDNNCHNQIFRKWIKHALPVNTKVRIIDRENKERKGLLKKYLEAGGIQVKIDGKSIVFKDSVSNIIPEL